jgi:class 3 adenylate cyclase/uncharacterized protein YggT (Ycf19 family)
MFFASLAYIVKLVKVALLFFVLLLIISFGSHFIDNPGQYTLLMKVTNWVHQVSQPLLSQIKLIIPYKFHGIDFSLLILAALLLMLANFCESFREKCLSIISKQKERKDYYEWRNQMSHVVSKEKISEIDSKFAALSTTKPSDRKQLLKEFADLKSKLDNMGQQLAFLAIDVVDSTGMKRHEDKHLAAYDFDRYNEFVDSCLKEHGVVKYAKTPDGIMSCFRTVDSAVGAAVCLLERLKSFNQNEKKIKQDFSIRCGINAGFVYVDEDTPLEHVSDRVIDIAGHMQKYAKPNCINIAATAIEPLKNRIGFNETTDVIDEQKVYEWRENKASPR